MSSWRGTTGFFRILLVLTLVCVGLIAGGLYVLRSVDEVQPAPPRASCVAGLDEVRDRLDVEQAANAATVGGVAFSRDLPEHAVVVAYVTVWQESQFYNLPFGDLDSVGLFQQRPSMDWGDEEELLDPVFASGAFYDELIAVPDYARLPVFEAAQAVQRSADGDYYKPHENRSEMMAEVFSGRAGPAVDCWFPPEEQNDLDLTAAEDEIRRVFGIGPNDLPSSQDPATGETGWAMALWAVSNAQEYGVTTVTLGEHQWNADSEEGNWSVLADQDALAADHLSLE